MGNEKQEEIYGKEVGIAINSSKHRSIKRGFCGLWTRIKKGEERGACFLGDSLLDVRKVGETTRVPGLELGIEFDIILLCGIFLAVLHWNKECKEII